MEAILAQLTKEELDKFEEKIDGCLPIEDLRKVPRRIAVVEALRAYEDYLRLYSLVESKGQSPAKLALTSKLLQDSAEFMMRWVYEYCPDSISDADISFVKPEIYELMFRVLRTAGEYSRVWDFMSMIRRGWMQPYGRSENVIELRTVGISCDGPAVADSFILSPDAPDSPVIDFSNFSPEDVVREARVRGAGTDTITYTTPVGCLSMLCKKSRLALDQIFDLDLSIDVGGYTIGDFKEFWACLLSSTVIHMTVCQVGKGMGINQLIRVMSRRQWINQLRSISKLPDPKLKAILTDLTYDHKASGNTLSASSQQFFDVGNDELALSNQFVLLSNAQRNLLHVINLKKGKVHSSLRNLKESDQITRLSLLFQRRGFEVHPRIKFGAGDIDLFVVDAADRFALVLQLKSLKAPDRINEVANEIKELNRGIEQANTAVAWAQSNKKLLSEKTGIALALLDDLEIRGACLSQNTIGGGRCMQDGTPVIPQRLVGWVLENPLQRSLRECWIIADKGTWYPKLGVHYEEGDTEARLGEISIISKNSGMRPLIKWDPMHDIDVSSFAKVQGG